MLNQRSPKNLVCASLYQICDVSTPSFGVGNRSISTWMLRRPGNGRLLEKKGFQCFGLLISKDILPGESYSCILNQICRKAICFSFQHIINTYGTHSTYIAIKCYIMLTFCSNFFCRSELHFHPSRLLHNSFWILIKFFQEPTPVLWLWCLVAAAPQHYCFFKFTLQNTSKDCRHTSQLLCSNFVSKWDPCLALPFFTDIHFGLAPSLAHAGTVGLLFKQPLNNYF